MKRHNTDGSLRARLVRGAMLLAISLVSVGQASAQAPGKPLRIIVPFAPGGALDVLMRRMGPIISDSTGQPVVIDNRPGGMTNIGMQACANAAPDGQTVCFTVDDSIVYNPLLFKKLPYDPAGLVPVVHLTVPRSVLVAKASAPFNNFKEFVTYAKANPGKLNFGTWGPSSYPDLYRQWIDRSAGTHVQGVPYKGVAGGTMPAVIAGETDLTILTIGQIFPQIQAGKVKAIAILGDKRWPGLPDVSTLAENGADPGTPSAWGIFAPPGTPAATVEKLNTEFSKALGAPSVREYLQASTLDAVGGSPSDFNRFLNDLRSNAQRVFRTLDIKPADQPS